jgi:hypothetical protein
MLKKSQRLQKGLAKVNQQEKMIVIQKVTHRAVIASLCTNACDSSHCDTIPLKR